MRIILLLTFLLTCMDLSARRVPKKLRQRFTNCLTGNPDITGGRISTGGYFEFRVDYPVPPRAYFVRMIFYPDGSFYHNRLAHNSPSDATTCSFLRGDSPYPDTSFLYRYEDWGVFRISNDTIIAQLIKPKLSMVSGWALYELKFRIIDPNTIQQLFLLDKGLFPGNITQVSLESIEGRTQSVAKFYPCDKIPAPNFWLKREPWLWCRDQ